MNVYSLAYKPEQMWSLSPQHLRDAMASANVNQSQLAEMVGVKQPSIGRLLSGDTKTTKAIDQIAAALGTTVAYLQGKTDDPSLHADAERQRAYRTEPPPRADNGTVELSEFDLSYGLGSSFIHDVPVTGVRRVFSRAWIRQFTNSPFDHLMFATGIGDSMTPTILDADIVLIDTFDRTPRFADKLWAVEIGGLGSIKRLRPTMDGLGMRLLSSNPDVPEDVAYDGEMQIVGRVAGIFRKT